MSAVFATRCCRSRSRPSSWSTRSPRRCSLAALLALVYDIHGNVAALDAVLDDARRAGADRWVLGGDLVAFGPDPGGTAARLHELDNAVWIRGNTERWLIETPTDLPQVWRGLHETRARLEWEQVEWLYALPTRIEVDGMLIVHGCPLTDCDTFSHAPEDEDTRRLAGVGGRTVVFGHSHRQFAPREGPNGTTLVNPGSVGQPLDGDPRAAYALLHDDGAFELRRVDYDHRASAAAMRNLGEWSEQFARRIELASA